jgi:hypothetical protein
MTRLDPITRATHMWAAQKLNIASDQVESVEFATSPPGCPTCGVGNDPEAEVTYRTSRGRSVKSIDFPYGYGPADMVREISALVTS